MKTPVRIPTTQQQRLQEAAWIEACHPHWGMVLMELAGYGASKVALKLLEQKAGSVVVLCGSGNNGGDGLVVARYLFLHGVDVAIFLIRGHSSTTRTEGQVNLSIVEKLGLTVAFLDESNCASVGSSLQEAALIVDALLGTGLDRTVQGVYKEVIDAINQSKKAVLAIDLPSGINSDNGQIMGAAVVATATATFGQLKTGLLCYPGADHSGELHLIEIGLPSLDSNIISLPDKLDQRLTTAQFVKSILPPRKVDSHKGSFGRILTVAGSMGMSGAAVLASKSALRTGAGLSVLATAKSLVPHLPCEELIYHALDDTAEGTISTKALAEIQGQLSLANAVVLGPGLSENAESIKLVQTLITVIEGHCVIDADGLNAIAHDTTVWPSQANRFVLTPHPKELARLIKSTSAEVQANRITMVRKAAEQFGCTVVLKGAHTLVANERQQIYINPTGNSGMATAGSGDVLSGIIGGLLAQGMNSFHAAIAGVYIHGLAGDLAAEAIGKAGIVATDIMNFVPTALSVLESNEYRGSSLELQLLSNGNS